MDAKDLMIGDWVNFLVDTVGGETREDPMTNEYQPMKIVSLSSWGSNDGEVESAEGIINDIDQLEPIPLTPEILEKNGFELKGSGWLWCEDKDVETQNYSFIQFRRNKEIRIVEINFLNKAVTKFRNVQNVHELQHALRLCGIDKEIKV